MGRVLLVLLVVVILAGAGYALYRIGYVNGVAAANDGHVVFGRFFGNFNLPEDMLKNHPPPRQPEPVRFDILFQPVFAVQPIFHPFPFDLSGLRDLGRL
ncbi:MAG: hypothetical protein P8Z42_13445 [Anaerolineales bacterium]